MSAGVREEETLVGAAACARRPARARGAVLLLRGLCAAAGKEGRGAVLLLL